MDSLNTIQRLHVNGVRDALLANGYFPLPCKPTKEPREGFHVRERLWDEHGKPMHIAYEAESESLLTAVRLVNSLVCIDLDILDGHVCQQVEQLAIEHFGKTAVRARDNTAKVALFYRAGFQFPKLIQQRKRMQIELRQQSPESSSSFYQLVDGATSEGRYYYRGAHLKDCRLIDLPIITEAQMLAFLSACEPLTGVQVRRERLAHPEPTVCAPEPTDASRETARAKAGAMLTKLAAWPDCDYKREYGNRYDGVNAVAKVLGGFVGAGNLSYEDAANWTLWAMKQNGYVAEKGIHRNLEWIRRGLEHGMQSPIAIEESKTLQAVRAFCENYDPKPKPKIAAKQVISRIEDIPDVLQLEDEPIEWLVPGLLAAGAITMIVGAAGCGKSSFISAMASHLANGTSFLNLPAFRQRPCLYLDRENGKAFVQERLRRLHCETAPNLTYAGGWFGEHLEPDSPMVREWVERQSVAPVVFLDSAVRFLDNENSTEDVKNFMGKLRWIADRGAAVVFLHHTGKGESTQSGRGSYDFTAASDFVFTMHNAGESKLTDINIRSTKQRAFGEFAGNVHYCNGTFSLDSVVAHRGVDGNTGQLLGYLQANPDIKKTEFERIATEKFGIAREKLRDWLTLSVAAGIVEITPGSHNAKYLRAKGSQVAPQVVQ